MVKTALGNTPVGRVISALAKVAAAIAPAQTAYTVVAGDTLSGIASNMGTTWQELARINGISNPRRLREGQRLAVPPRPAAPATARTVAPAPIAAPGSTPESRLNSIAARLHAKLNNPNLEAAILANFDRETGGRFDPSVRRVGGGGYGIPQYAGPTLKAYRSWLASGNRADSAENQVDYFVDTYMPTRAGYKRYTAPGAKYTREQYADWLHRNVFTPAHTIPSNKAYSIDMINRLTRKHNAFMRDRLQSVDGVWQAVKTSAAHAVAGYERPYTAKQMLAAGYARELVDKLMRDPVHRWRARTGIELIHKEPDLREALRVWVNWNRMTAADKRRSDRKSMAVFGVDNKTNFERLRPTYDDGKESRS